MVIHKRPLAEDFCLSTESDAVVHRSIISFHSDRPAILRPATFCIVSSAALGDKRLGTMRYTLHVDVSTVKSVLTLTLFSQ